MSKKFVYDMDKEYNRLNEPFTQATVEQAAALVTDQGWQANITEDCGEYILSVQAPWTPKRPTKYYSPADMLQHWSNMGLVVK